MKPGFFRKWRMQRSYVLLTCTLLFIDTVTVTIKAQEESSEPSTPCSSSSQESTGQNLTLGQVFNTALATIKWRLNANRQEQFNIRPENYFKDMDPIKMVVRRIPLKDEEKKKGQTDDGLLEATIAKNLNENEKVYKNKGWPKVIGRPLIVYSQILTDINRSDFEVNFKGQKIYSNKSDKLKSEPQAFIKLFNGIKMGVLNGLLDIDEELKGAGREGININEDIINDVIHKAIASRVQTFDADMWAKINSEVRPEFEPPLVKIKERMNTFKIVKNRLIVQTKTDYQISYNSYLSPHHGKDIGVVSTLREMEFDVLSGQYTDELHSLKK